MILNTVKNRRLKLNEVYGKKATKIVNIVKQKAYYLRYAVRHGCDSGSP